MNKITLYIRDSYKEMMQKVTWPSWEQLQQSTMIVLAATIIITAIVALMDLGINGILQFVYSLFK
jgi:preprotein translocase subunit SecE